MRQLVITVLTITTCAQIAHGAERCQFQNKSGHRIEWSDGDEDRGARIASRDPRWELSDGLAWHGITTAECLTCSSQQIGGGSLWLWVSDPSQRDLYKSISPESVAERMWGFPFRFNDAEFRAKSEAVQVSVDGLAGPARVLSINDRNGRSSQVIAFAVAKECLSLLGILYEKDGAPTSLDRLDAFASALAVEYYKPDGSNFARPPGPAGELHIGDLRRLLLGEQP